MSGIKQKKGRYGELLAKQFLRRRGFRIVAENWTCKCGEIDLIVRRGREWRFVEVKYRTNTEYGFPEEAITETKLRHIKQSAELFLLRLKRPPKHYQIDVVSILKNGQNKPDFHWIVAV